MSGPAVYRRTPGRPSVAPASENGPESWWSASHLIGFVLLWAIAQLAAAHVWYPEVFSGGQVDTDGFMRLVRVRELLQGGAWYDPVIERSNWPYGEVMHWTRPLDIVIIALALPFRAFVPGDTALAVAGAIVSPLCHLAVCVGALWAVHPIVRSAERFFAMPAVLAQTSVMAYGGVGRADHHLLIFLLFTLALGCWIRVLLNAEDRRAAVLAGAFSGIGMWTGPETLLPLAVLFLSGTLAWVVHGSRFTGPNLRLSAGFAAAVLLAIIAERAPGGWLTAEFDRISIAHFHVGLLALGYWWAVKSVQEARSELLLEHTRRAAAAGVGAVVAASVLLMLHPRFFRGPWVDVDPAVIGVWLERVSELQPALPRAADEVGIFLSMLGAAMLLIPFVSLWALREANSERRLVWLLLLISLIVYVPLAAAQQRFAPYAGIIAAIGSIELLRRGFARLDTVSGMRLRALRILLILGVLLWPIVAGETLMAFLPGSAQDSSAAGPPACNAADAAARLNDPAVAGTEPLAVAAFIDFGPELLYRTEHRVLAGPYHRNRSGILDSHELLSTADERRASEIARERHVDLILLCPGRDMEYFRGTSPTSLYARMLRGEAPSWIREVPFASPGFRLFAVSSADASR